MKNKLNFKKHALLFAFSLTALLFTACHQNSGSKAAKLQIDNDYKLLDTDKFSIAVPKAWRKDVQNYQSFKILFFYAPVDRGSTPNINMLTEDMHGLSESAYIAASKQKVQQGGIVLGQSGDFEANGIKGMYSINTFNYSGRQLAEKLYIFTKDGTAFVITGTCLIDQKDKYQPIFDKIAKTLTVK